LEGRHGYALRHGIDYDDAEAHWENRKKIHRERWPS
jgi:hypothetical protein